MTTKEKLREFVDLKYQNLSTKQREQILSAYLKSENRKADAFTRDPSLSVGQTKLSTKYKDELFRDHSR